MSTTSKLTFGFLFAKFLELNCFGTKNPSNGRNFLVMEEAVHSVLACCLDTLIEWVLALT